MNLRRVSSLIVACAVSACASAGRDSPPGAPGTSRAGADALADGGPLGAGHVISHGSAPVEPSPGPAGPEETSPPQGADRVACAPPRGTVCTKQYRPVCAEVDTGIRCIQAPCPSSERRTFGNACEACADPKVMAYSLGACPGAT